MENSVNRNKVAHTHEVVYTLTHWLDDEVFEQCPTWQDCLRSGVFTSPELEKFFGEAREGENGNLIGGPGNYEQCVQTGVGRNIIAKMLEGTESSDAIKQALQNLPMTNRRLRGIEQQIEEAQQALGDEHQITVTLRDMSDVEMFRIMGLENSEDWMNPVQHTEQVIKQGRAFFDSWLDRFCTWDDFVQTSGFGGLPEFGPSAQAAVKQMTDWLGGAAEAPHNYANIVKYGVGIQILHRFTGIPKHTIEAALKALGPTEREKRMLEKMDAERKAAINWPMAIIGSRPAAWPASLMLN